MPEQRVERVDELPIVMLWLEKMGVRTIINDTWRPHGNWKGLDYGQLAVFFLTYVISSFNHRLCYMENWVEDHQNSLRKISGWEFNPKDATDDRLGIILEELGSDDEQIIQFQEAMGRNVIVAYDLPTEIGRYDTTSCSVFHEANENNKKLLRHGHSKDHRPELLQFKQGLGTLDPAGVPLIAETIAGNVADDTLYLKAWHRLADIMNRQDFLYVADCKAAAIDTRAGIAQNGGRYLFPLPKTGDTPKLLQTMVLQPPSKPEVIYLQDPDGKPRKIGRGFVNSRIVDTNGTAAFEWEERLFVLQSTSYAKSQKKACVKRLGKAEEALLNLKPKKNEAASELHQRAEKILQTHKCQDLISLEVEETVYHQYKNVGRGRPAENSKKRLIETKQSTLHFKRDRVAIKQYLKLAGWRIYVTNATADEMSLEQSVRHYRNEWLVEHGFHRFKNGSLPALPIFIRTPERIKGLMMMLTIALQGLTLIEYVARRNLAEAGETLAGLVPGNPKRSTARPTAERLLAQFSNLHLLITESGKTVSCQLLETLSPLQRLILKLLNVSSEIYELTFSAPKFADSA